MGYKAAGRTRAQSSHAIVRKNAQRHEPVIIGSVKLSSSVPTSATQTHINAHSTTHHDKRRGRTQRLRNTRHRARHNRNHP